ncbi:proline-specific peptidase [Viridothelium virens]|uniref:Proline-specific peptidase n=1 Tax=Viridothelium virens TaxID=1048519 RepID=A0A6A6HBT2_VIRVR|nr:proline-specific peptidase [Viridothelium virens]
MLHSQEARVQVTVPSTNRVCYTWYKIFGHLESHHVPLVVLHGGPGACHEYMLPYRKLTERFGIPTIFYDQLGNGNSTRLPEKNGDGAFWTESLFSDELNNLIDHLDLRKRGFDLLGHSWGGMLCSAYACSQPTGLRRVIITDAPADVGLWEEAAKGLVSRLPRDVQELLGKEQELSGSEKFDAAMETFRKITFANVISRLHRLRSPVLLLNGEDDQAQDNTMRSFFDILKKVQWEKIEEASHNPHLEQPETVIEIVAKFLLDEGLFLLDEQGK